MSELEEPVQSVKEECKICETTCVECQVGRMLKITYGYLTSGIIAAEEQNTVIWGGCMPAGRNMHQCTYCRARVGQSFSLQRPLK